MPKPPKKNIRQQHRARKATSRGLGEGEAWKRLHAKIAKEKRRLEEIRAKLDALDRRETSSG
jgi:hypothetical protein